MKLKNNEVALLVIANSCCIIEVDDNFLIGICSNLCIDNIVNLFLLTAHTQYRVEKPPPISCKTTKEVKLEYYFSSTTTAYIT